MRFKQNWLEIIGVALIIIIFVFSFSFAMDTFTGKSFIPTLIVFLDNLTLNVVTFYATFIFLALSGCVLLYPNKDAINSFLTKILRPILKVVSLTIVNGKILWNNAEKNDIRNGIKIRVENRHFKIDKFDVKCGRIRFYSDKDYIYWEFIK
jgi:hypothetical protein